MAQLQQQPSAMQTVRARIRDQWRDLADADIEGAGGSLEKLVTLIARKTGAPRAEIRTDLRRIFSA